MTEAIETVTAAGSRAVTVPDEAYVVAVPDIAPEPIKIPSEFATLWFWAFLFRRTLYKTHADNVWASWERWIETKPDRTKQMFILLPSEARRVIMERQVDILLAEVEAEEEQEVGK